MMGMTECLMSHAFAYIQPEGQKDVCKNQELYGHPDGCQEMSIGIGLLRWIVEGRNNIWVLSFYTLAFGGTLPLLMVGQSLFSICLVTSGCVFH
jgi:preprotein translocase subunit Sec63